MVGRATLASVAGSVLLAGCSVLGIRSGYEQPPYDVIDTLDGGIEIRRYGPRLAAETSVDAASEEEGRSAAFRILAAYIFGENRSSEKVGMTSPVEVQEDSTSIAMTAPVETTASEGRVTMRFFMPSRFSAETLPEPTDPRVRIVEAPGETLAVLRFRGFGRAGAVEEHTAELLQALADSGWQPQGEPIALFYDPPWTLPFLRRNEVGVRVAPTS